MASRRLIVVIILLCVATMNILIVSTMDQGEYGIAAKNPGQDSNDVYRRMVFERVNVERWRNDLNEFRYIRDDRTQEHAVNVLLTGDRSLNPALDPGVGENVAYYRIRDKDVLILVERIVTDMAGNMAGGSRENLLNPRFRYVSVGVAFNDRAICVVIDFFTGFNIE